MERTARAAVLVALSALASCGSGGSSGSGGSTGASGLTGSLAVLDHSPANDAEGVPVDVRIRVELDAAAVHDSLGYSDTGLFAGGTAVPGSFVLESGGNTVVFVPQSDLRQQTDYVFQLSPLTCDGSGRILDQQLTIAFRTIDQRPPAVAGASLAAGQTGVSQTGAIVIGFDEDLLATSATSSNVWFQDDFGAVVPAGAQVDGGALSATPIVDLSGDRHYTLHVKGGAGGVSDRAGNELSNDWSVDFRTTPDTTAPMVMAVHPAGSSTSPLAHLRITFSESVDPASVEPASIVLLDEFASIIPFDLLASADQRTLRLAPRTPLMPGRSYAVTVLSGFGALTDVSGNFVVQPHTAAFTAGSDVTPPETTSTHPLDNATSASLNTWPTATFAEALDPSSVSESTVELLEGSTRVAADIVLEAGNTVVTVRPRALLAKGRQHHFVIRGGVDGLLDVAGNPMLGDLTVTFNTTNDGTLPSVQLLPTDGNAGVPYTARLTALFDEPIDPNSVTDATVRVTGPGNTIVPGTISLARTDRVIHFEPTGSWSPGNYYTFTIVGGPQGVREVSGNHLATDQTSKFQVIAVADTVNPTLEITLNGIADPRKTDLSLPTWGFDIDVSAADPQHFSLDMSTIQVTLSGPGTMPGTESVFAQSRIDTSTLHYNLPSTWALQPGDYTVTAAVSDLSGNTGRSGQLRFRVEQPDDNALPFERTQIMWVRFDLDRDANGRPDLDDDMLLLGLITPGDPAGTNDRMRNVMRAGILARCNTAFGRAASGTPLGSHSVPVRLTDRQPLGIVHATMACSGMDPEGSRARGFGSGSTGTLGRAFFDYRNANAADHNVATAPGLGVFPAEVFFFEVGIHQQVSPQYTTLFAEKFLPVCPDLGGTAAGSDPLDATVLSAGFDYTTGTLAERRRFNDVFGAVDDWASVIGVILAHEIGHAVGLVASGANPLGLHGDASLHNEFSSAESIMSPALGYESMLFLDFVYRDLNLAYLRQRLLMK